jgi:hypothetical protein
VGRPLLVSGLAAGATAMPCRSERHPARRASSSSSSFPIVSVDAGPMLAWVVMGQRAGASGASGWLLFGCERDRARAAAADGTVDYWGLVSVSAVPLTSQEVVRSTAWRLTVVSWPAAE